MIATTLAVRRPATVRRLILVAPAGLDAVPPALSKLFVAGADPLLAVRRRLLPFADFQWGRKLLLAGADLPLGAIWGRADRTVPSFNLGALRRARPDVQVELLDRAGHVPMVERPQEFIAAMERLLQRVPIRT
jgi:pimeloyl-ACP methyl ester carboxylesterase